MPVNKAPKSLNQDRSFRQRSHVRNLPSGVSVHEKSKTSSIALRLKALKTSIVLNWKWNTG